MEQTELIKFISEFGILVVIAGLYLYERFMADKDSVNVLRDLKSLLEDFNSEKSTEISRSLSAYEFHSVMDLYFSSQKCELIMESDTIVTMNHIHGAEEHIKSQVIKMVQRVHARHTDFIDTLTYKGKPLVSILDNQDFIKRKAEICSEWILGEEHSPLSLFRSLDSYFEYYKLQLE